MWEACTAAGTHWWLGWWRWALLRAVCVLTACLHAPRSSLDLNRAFISKWMTLNWSGKYTGCLLIIGRVHFFPTVACTGTDGPIDEAWTGEIRVQDREADTDNNCHVITMTDNSKLCCATLKSRASPVNNALGQFWGILCPFFSHSSPSISLKVPPPIFHSFFYFTPARPLALLTPQRGGGGGRITDKSPGVLDSAVLVRAQHILARRRGCHRLKSQTGHTFHSHFSSLYNYFAFQ